MIVRPLLLVLALPFAVAAVVPDGERKPPAPLKLGPRAYYRDHCQRCHGVDGSNLEPGYAQKETLEKLKADVKRMAEGPGGKPLEGEDLDAQTEYMRLASAGRPFLAWTGVKGAVVAGEASDGAKVVATVGDRALEVKTDEDNGWTVTLPSEGDLARLKVTATLEKKDCELRPAEKAWAEMPKDEKAKPSVGG